MFVPGSSRGPAVASRRNPGLHFPLSNVAAFKNNSLHNEGPSVANFPGTKEGQESLALPSAQLLSDSVKDVGATADSGREVEFFEKGAVYLIVDETP